MKREKFKRCPKCKHKLKDLKGGFFHCGYCCVNGKGWHTYHLKNNKLENYEFECQTCDENFFRFETSEIIQ